MSLFAPLILAPDQKYHCQVKDRQKHKPYRMSVRVAVTLVGDEDAEKPKRQWIGPKSVSQQACHQEKLDQAMNDQIDARKDLGIRREVLDRTAKVVRNSIFGIFCQFRGRKKQYEGVNELLSDEQDKKSANSFYQASQSLDPHTAEKERVFNFPIVIAFHLDGNDT